MRFPGILPVVVAIFLAGCDHKQPSITANPVSPSDSKVLVPAEFWKEFSGEKALEEVRKQVDIGPRPSGSSGIVKAQAHITTTLKANGWDVELQEFRETPVPGRGDTQYTNIIARFPGAAGKPASTATQRVIVGSHYDTKVMDVRFVGANDAGSSTGALLELSRVLASQPAFAAKFELVFFDGEEALVSFGSAELGPDGLIGSRYYAKSIRKRAAQFKFAVVWDMIADNSLKITLPSDTPRTLSGALFAAAESAGTRSHFGFFNGEILDDHVPIVRIARIPAMDIIDFEYPTAENPYWHTAEDTMDKISAASLEIVGRTTLKMLINELAGN